jgi:hypothetical protein
MGYEIIHWTKQNPKSIPPFMFWIIMLIILILIAYLIK